MDCKISQYISCTHFLYNLKVIFIVLGSKRRKRILINDCLPVALASQVPNVIFKLTKLKSSKLKDLNCWEVFIHLLNIGGCKQAIISKI